MSISCEHGLLRRQCALCDAIQETRERTAELEAQPTPGASVWLRVIDEELVCAHIGIANVDDGYATAKEKMDRLIEWHIAVATDPKVGGRAPAQDEAMRRDAERYRWLRRGGNDDIGVVRGFDSIDCGSTSVAYTYEEGLCGERMDAAIDAAIAQRGDGGE